MFLHETRVKNSGKYGTIGWHTFRHTYRSWLDETGAPMKVQHELMRHASIQTTMNVYGQAMSSSKHRSQGKSVDHVIVSADVMKQELFYVAASRGREGISIVTSDVEHLGESLGVSMARPSAIELANELSQSKQSPEHHAEMNPKQVNESLKPPHDIGFEYGMGLEL